MPLVYGASPVQCSGPEAWVTSRPTVLIDLDDNETACQHKMVKVADWKVGQCCQPNPDQWRLQIRPWYSIVVGYWLSLCRVVFGKVRCATGVMDIDYGVLVVAQAAVLFVVHYLRKTFVYCSQFEHLQVWLAISNTPPPFKLYINWHRIERAFIVFLFKW